MKPYIIGAIVGAIIGYITNYIAIKMLFRPYKEKRIFGMKAPFTPGLIPKEKPRIAKSVGETIGTHLLTSETIIGALEGNTIKKHMRSVIEDKVNIIAQEEKPLCEKLEGIFGNSYRGLKLKLEVKIYDIIITKIRNKSVIEKISTIIYEKILLSLRDKPDMLVSLIENESFREKIINVVERYKNSDELKEKINDGILNEIKGLAQGDKKVKQIIPQEVFGAVDVYIYNERNNISGEIGELLRNQDVSAKIKTAINDNILSGMSPLVSMFLNVDSLYNKFLSAADGYLSQEENKVVIVKKLSQYVHKLSEKDIKDIMDNIPENTKVAVSEIIGYTLKDKLIKGELVQAQLNNLLEKLKTVESYDSLICKINEDYKEYIKKFIKDNLDIIVNEASTETIIKDGVIKGINEFLNIETKSIVTEKEHITEAIYSMIEKTYDKLIEKEAVNVISLINIPKIVEEQINSFEVDFAEKIILEISSKELGAITWLGALLGGVLGILSPLLARLSS